MNNQMCKAFPDDFIEMQKPSIWSYTTMYALGETLVVYMVMVVIWSSINMNHLV